MKSVLWTRSAFAAFALAATACGMQLTQQVTPPELVQDLAAQSQGLHPFAPGADPNAAAACAVVEARLRGHREELAATPEWHDLVATSEWTTLTDAVKRAVDANCEFMSVGEQCGALMQQVRQAFGALKATPAYGAAEATPEWQTLKGDYAAARENDCWEQWHDADADAGNASKSLEPDGPINPSPNPAPNPTSVPPTNPTTGNTEPNGGQPNTSPEPSHGPINPSPNPAPNPTPVPPTNPDTGNTGGGQ